MKRGGSKATAMPMIINERPDRVVDQWKRWLRRGLQRAGLWTASTWLAPPRARRLAAILSSPSHRGGRKAKSSRALTAHKAEDSFSAACSPHFSVRKLPRGMPMVKASPMARPWNRLSARARLLSCASLSATSACACDNMHEVSPSTAAARGTKAQGCQRHEGLSPVPVGQPAHEVHGQEGEEGVQPLDIPVHLRAQRGDLHRAAVDRPVYISGQGGEVHGGAEEVEPGQQNAQQHRPLPAADICL
eukprot:scaffold4342_cov166-Ochromonas_danica.AAC.7